MGGIGNTLICRICCLNINYCQACWHLVPADRTPGKFQGLPWNCEHLPLPHWVQDALHLH